MSAIYYHQGSIFPCSTRYLFHPVGIGNKYSTSIFERYPFALEMYNELASDYVRPGTMQIVKCRDVIILNAFVYVNNQLSFDALNACLEEIDYTIYGEGLSFCKHFFPGRDWAVVEGLIESRIETMNPIVYY